jgi:ubiquitin-like modifier-activating enzyme 5
VCVFVFVYVQVVDSNPYSRLMALKKMGICPLYESIRDYAVVVVGLGTS